MPKFTISSDTLNTLSCKPRFLKNKKKKEKQNKDTPNKTKKQTKNNKHFAKIYSKHCIKCHKKLPKNRISI